MFENVDAKGVGLGVAGGGLLFFNRHISTVAVNYVFYKKSEVFNQGSQLFADLQALKATKTPSQNHIIEVAALERELKELAKSPELRAFHF